MVMTINNIRMSFPPSTTTQTPCRISVIMLNAHAEVRGVQVFRVTLRYDIIRRERRQTARAVVRQTHAAADDCIMRFMVTISFYFYFLLLHSGDDGPREFMRTKASCVGRRRQTCCYTAITVKNIKPRAPCECSVTYARKLLPSRRRFRYLPTAFGRRLS